jgi:hypothetical protein
MPTESSMKFSMQFMDFTSAFTKNVFPCPLPLPFPPDPVLQILRKISIRKIKAELSIYSKIKDKLSHKPMRKLEFLLVLPQKGIYQK